MARLSPDSTPRTVLIVDDREANRFMLAHVLKGAGYATREVATGAGALDVATQGVDLVLLDVQLPDMLGFEVCQRLKGNPTTAQIPIIQLSASYTLHSDRMQGLAGGADDYLLTPVEPPTLLGKVQAVLASAETVRERARLLELEKAVRAELADATRALRRHAAILEHVRESLVVTDLDGRITFWNSGAEEVFGYTAEEVLGCSAGMLYPDEDAVALGATLEQIRAGTDFSGEWKGRRKDGTTVWLEVHTRLLRGPGGEIEGFIGVSRDVSARRTSELARARALEQVTHVLESMGDGFLAVDAQWRITLQNQHHERLSGKARAATVGRDFFEAFPAAADAASVLGKGARRAMTERVATQQIEMFGGTWIESAAYPTADGGVAIFFRDVSGGHQREAELKQQAELEKQLVGIVSHDLKTPLSAILLSAATALKREPKDARVTKALGRIVESGQRASRMVLDLLDYTRARVGRGIPTERGVLDLHEVVRRAVEEVRSANPDRTLSFEHSGDGATEGDADRLAQVVTNLADNALAYSPTESTVSVSSHASDVTLVIEVHNFGAPIPPELIGKMFQPLERGAQQRAKSHAGLGLFIVDQLVRAHHGTIAVRSGEAEGTTFTVQLPRA